MRYAKGSTVADIFWSADAIRDLESVESYLATGSPSFARIYVKRLSRAVEVLKGLPRIGRMVPELEREDIREVIFQNYRLPYQVSGDRVLVLAVKKMPLDLHRIFGPRLLPDFDP